MKNGKRTVITGVAPLCSLGIGKEALWDAVVKGRTHVVEDRFLMGDELSEPFYFHKMDDDFDISSFGFDAKTLQWITEWKQGYIDMDLMYLAAAVKLAITDSGLKYDSGNNDIGLVLTHENPGLENFFERVASLTYDYMQNESAVGGHSSKKMAQKINKKDVLGHVYSQCEILGYDMQTFMYLFFVAKLFSIHGFSLFLNNACASGPYALEIARQQILLGRCPAVIVAGADRPRMAYKHLWFKNNNLYATDGLIKPFCKNRNGFVFGDASTGLVLEDYEHAKARGASIYGEYLGGGFNLECGKVTLPDVTQDYYKRCIETAINDSGVSKDKIDLIVPHGIGTSITDLHEARTISTSFANLSEPPLVTAFKPYFGHNLGGCALLETVLLLLAMNHDYVPRTLNCEPVDPKINLNLAVRSVSKPLRTVMKMSCGFAGYNGVSILRKIE